MGLTKIRTRAQAPMVERWWKGKKSMGESIIVWDACVCQAFLTSHHCEKGFCVHIYKWKTEAHRLLLVTGRVSTSSWLAVFWIHWLYFYLSQYAMDKPLVSYFVKIQSHPRIVRDMMLSSWHLSHKKKKCSIHKVHNKWVCCLSLLGVYRRQTDLGVHLWWSHENKNMALYH